MGVQILFGLLVDIDLELRDLVLSFRDDKEVIGGQDLELFALLLLFVLLRRSWTSSRITARNAASSTKRRALKDETPGSWGDVEPFPYRARLQALSLTGGEWVLTFIEHCQ